MPIYLYASIGALIFAIVHGMHFSVSPIPEETGGYIREIATAMPDTHEQVAWTHPDIRFAGIEY